MDEEEDNDPVAAEDAVLVVSIPDEDEKLPSRSRADKLEMERGR